MESKTKLLDQMRHVLRLKHLSIRTEKAYVQWAKRFILFHHKRHPADMGAPEIRQIGKTNSTFALATQERTTRSLPHPPA